MTAAHTSFAGLRIALVGPLPPPAGGMANQTRQLATLLRAAGATVQLVAVNPPHRPPWLARVPVLRALFRLPRYVGHLWRAAGSADVFHVMANSGWSWHLYAAPAIWVGHLRGTSVLVNYRGGEADAFLQRRHRLIRFSLARADGLVGPSAYLAGVFARYGHTAQIVPNIIDLARFTAPAAGRQRQAGPVVLVPRHLEPIYDNASALRAMALVRSHYPQARLLLAGAGPARAALEQLTAQLGLGDAVTFTGPLDHAAMAALYRSSDIVLNPALADNMPNSVLEALACRVPVVSTWVGGVVALVEHGHTARLVAPGDSAAMAAAIVALLDSPDEACRLVANGWSLVQQFGWDQVALRLLQQYQRCQQRPRPAGYTALVSRLLFPLHEWLKRHDSVARRKALERSQWWTPAALEQLQLARLRALLLHAKRHVPYYRELFGASRFDPADVRSVADLARLPLLDKATISAVRDSFKSVLAPPLTRLNTGGSSGQPLVFFVGRDRVSADVAAKWRATRWWGVDIGDRETVLWGSPLELGAQDRLRRLRDRLLRSTLLPAFAMSPAKLDGFIGHLERSRPRMLFGYPSALSHLARHAQSRAVRLDRLGIKAAFVTSERLYDAQRALIETVFGCPVANGYGGRDAGFIAHECPHGGLHISAEDIIVEIVDAQGQVLPPGRSGQIVVTHLASADFPFIRYATGDIGTLDPAPCACGRGLPLLQRLDGRSTDFVVAQDGTVMHGLALIYILRDLPQLSAFKIVQESLQLTRVLVVALTALDAATRATIETGFKARLGPSVAVVIDEVADIAAEASGKFRYVISKVAPT